ncbi:helicase HerA-like domain-containing protein [Sorangium sp. So ce726]|uniref:helicase HerA-like domain-containing protein n=1 Tax=Sorangium sp. So ce726 TaxID=3133319 RepID=UPI003F63055B
MARREIASNPASVRIAKLALAELEEAAMREEFGIVMEDVTPIDLSTLIHGLTQPKVTRAKRRLRVALVDEHAVVKSATGRFSSLVGMLSSHEEEAVQWRNKKQRTIALITTRALEKARTFAEFRRINERDLARRLCAEQRDGAEVTWLRTLWDALERGRALRISLVDTVQFALALESLSPAERSAQAPRHLHVLGLFPDSMLADERSEQRILRRLAQNRELVSDIKRATSEDWSRVRAYCKSLSGSAKTSAGKLVPRVRKITQGEPLEGLDFEGVLSLWRGKIASKGAGGTKSGDTRVAAERVVGRKLLANDTSHIRDIAEELTQIVQVALDDDSRAGVQDVRTASADGQISFVEVRRDLLELVRSRSTTAEWGGMIEVASDKPGAMTEVTAFKSWAPFMVARIQEILLTFAQEGIAPRNLVELFARLTALHTSLVPHAPQLALSPVIVLAGEPGALEAAEEYLSTYEQLLRQVQLAYHEMHAAADFEAEQVIGLLLCLELYVFRNGDGVEAVMSPLHPLYLWRSVALVREVRGLGTMLSKHELSTIEEACAEDLQILQVLVLPSSATGSDQSQMLGQAGSLGRLPVFRESPRGMLEADGVRAVAEFAQRLAKLRPFVRPGLQILMVNLPKPGRFIQELIDRLDLENTSSEETFWGIHIRVRYTQDDTRGWANDVNDLDDTLRERLTTAEERGLLTLSVVGEVMKWEKVLEELREYPSHLTVVVDPFEVRSMPVARAQIHALSPWMPTCEYRFNRIRKEVQVIPVAEEHVFGSYLAAAALVHTALQRKTPAHLPQVREVKDALDAVAEHSTWTIVADPHRVPLARLGAAEVIDRRVERGRQLTCFAHDLAPFQRRLDDQLRRTHFLAEPETLQRLVRDLVAMEPNGILGLAATNQDKQVKGSLGKLIAVRWYRTQQPSGLAVSLDTPTAARWLVAGNYSREKADLLGLREEDGLLVIDVIEVKAHDEATPYTVKDGTIEGRAVGQVLATLQALAEVFTPGSRSPLARPRREVLREHLYTALVRDQEAEYVERWHVLLQDVFEGKVPVRLAGRIVHVQLASVAHREAQVYLSVTGVPVRVDTLTAEDVGLVLRSSRGARQEPEAAPPGVQVADRIEPAEALAKLQPGVAPVAEAPATAGTGNARAASDQPGEAPPNSRGGVAPPGPNLAPHGPTAPAGGITIDVTLGTEHASSTAVHWVPGRQSNGFFLILGASGSGKTETLKVLGESVVNAGVPVLVFDFHGDVILPGMRSVLLSSGAASKFGLNPMELDVHSAQESGLYDQRAALRGMIQRAVPALGHRQSSILREAFDAAYARAGILDDDDSTWRRAAPSFGDIESILDGWAQDDARKGQRTAIEGCLAAVQELFGHPIFGRPSHISVEQILSESLRLDLSKLPDQVRFIATETLLRKIFRMLRLKGPIPVQPADDRERFRLFVLIDEAKILSLGGGERDRTDNILNELITEARKFGLGMILASQMSDHFSEEVRANAATWLVLKPMDIREARKNAPNVSVDPDDLIHLAGRGDGYYRDRPSARARRIQVRPKGAKPREDH